MAATQVNTKYVKLYNGDAELLGITAYNAPISLLLGDTSVELYDENLKHLGFSKGTYLLGVQSMGDVPVTFENGVWVQRYSLDEGDETRMDIFFTKNFGDVSESNFSGTLTTANMEETWPFETEVQNIFRYSVVWTNEIPWSIGDEFNGAFTIGGITVKIKCIVVE